MKAVLCTTFGPPESLIVDEVPDPIPGPGQVVIDVHACGVNFPDLLMIQDLYQFKPDLPFSPGGEVAGIVSALGPDVGGLAVGGLAVGDRVIAATGWGGLAEKVVAAAGSVQPVPDGMDLATASGFLYAYGTSQHALVNRAQLASGETLLVLGAAGGVGLAAVDIGRVLGARIIAAASSADKLALCREYGATETINYAEEDLRSRLKELTGGRGVDVVYDPVGGSLSEAALRSMAWNGRFLVIGFAAGEIPRIPLNLALLKGCSIVGVFWGAFAAAEPERNRQNVEQLRRWWAEGAIHPHVSATYPLERGAEAIAELGRRRAKGKVVVLTAAGMV
ncbi:MAG TPA: NADPH:quinone oxidoreductase family protein [Mycobacteriales bacterium]|nr:NADPH:quinone oxidoreductase family protein [Mycobacteriales bacterium]